MGNCGITILKKVSQCPNSDSKSKEKSNPKSNCVEFLNNTNGNQLACMSKN